MAPTGQAILSTEWDQLQDKFYRKQEIYSMLWNQSDLSKFVISGASFGGSIAMIRDDRKLLLLNKQQPTNPKLFMYTSSGRLMAQVPWDRGRIVGMGWTDSEHLLCVLEVGTVLLYDVHGDFTQFSLGKDATEEMIIDCQVWGNGLVAMTSHFKLILVNGFNEPRPRLMADPGLDEPPHSWAVVPPQYTLSGHAEVYLATRSTILVIDAQDCQDQSLQQGPFTKMAVSPNGKLLALFTVEGKLWVVSMDFQKSLTEFSTKSKHPPQQLVWCGTDSVVMQFDRTLLMVGPFGDWIKYAYEGHVHLVPEIDGVRIISSDKCEFLQKVPDVTEDIFKLGSTSPAAMLYDALEHFERRSPQADANIRDIRTELTEAVDACIEAAGYEISHQSQKKLLKAASFGKCFLDLYSADTFVNMAQTLRVLNAVRYYEIGIPLTFIQYIRLTPDALIDRLISRHHHLLAVRISEFLKMRTDRVLIHWACAKIKKSTQDEETICRAIIEQLGSKQGLGYAEIAKTAYKVGQPKLATKLLDYEPRAGDQVPLLMSMQEDELALTKACESGDTDLVYHVILHLKRKLPLGEFFRIVSRNVMASALVELYAEHQDPQLLKDFYFQDDRRAENAGVVLRESFNENDVSQKVTKLKVAAKLYHDDKERGFEAKCLDEQVKLLACQVQLEKDVPAETFQGLSVIATIHKLLILNQESRAAKVKTDFKVHDKSYWWTKLKACVERRDWESLQKFSVSKKSPIGYVPFVEECIRAKQYGKASEYILRCDAPIRAGLFLRIEEYKKAADHAFQQKNQSLLIEIRNRCAAAVGGGGHVLQEIEHLIAQMAK